MIIFQKTEKGRLGMDGGCLLMPTSTACSGTRFAHLCASATRLLFMSALLWAIAAPKQVGAQAGLPPNCERYAMLVQQLVTKTFGVGSPESEATFGMIKALITSLARSKTGAYTAEEQAAVRRFVAVSGAAQDEVVRGLQRIEAKLRGKSESERRRLMKAGLAAEMQEFLVREKTLKYALKTAVVCSGR